MYVIILKYELNLTSLTLNSLLSFNMSSTYKFRYFLLITEANNITNGQLFPN